VAKKAKIQERKIECGLLGILCGNDSLSYVVVDGKPDSPKVIECETIDSHQFRRIREYYF
jgi:hypothetical protein